MKIGTITFWDSEENYGQILQCFALVRFLNNLGHNAVLVKNKKCIVKGSILHKLFTLIDVISDWSFYSNLFKKKIEVTNIANRSTNIDRRFSDFKKRYIPSTDKIYEYDELLASDDIYDAYICGSDQIWSDLSPLMFLQFTKKSKRISYAASFGGCKFTNRLDKRTLYKYLKSFDYVSVRESEGLDICNNFGITCDLVPDPTLLIDENVYSKIASNNNKYSNEERYILLYLLGNEIDFEVKDVFMYADQLGYKVVYVASQGKRDEYNKENPSIEEWLWLYKHAEVIITNSFHGTVFSLIFHKKFLTILLKGEHSRMNNRIKELLNKYNLNDRIFDGLLTKVETPISYEVFEKVNLAEKQYVIDKFKKLLV